MRYVLTSPFSALTGISIDKLLRSSGNSNSKLESILAFASLHVAVTTILSSSYFAS